MRLFYRTVNNWKIYNNHYPVETSKAYFIFRKNIKRFPGGGSCMEERYVKIETDPISGGMGSTFKAFDNNLQREVIIKTISKELLEASQGNSERYKRLFKDEAKLQAKLSHFHIAQVYDYYELNQVGYIVFEYVNGCTLDQLEFFGKITNLTELNLALNILMQVAKGIEFAHKHEIIHRDLKPNNIMYSRIDNVAKIIDFGIAKVKEELPRDYTVAGFGTQGYAAPERTGLYRIDTEARFDVFSFGVICFGMLTGFLPFRDDSDYIKRIPAVSDYRSDINEDINEFILGMIQPDPKDRIGTLQGFISSVERQLSQGFKKPLETYNLLAENKVRDPIHGYISFSNLEKKIIDHPIFQRLRRIKQLSTTYLVYPGATHDRFSHSLGVMHIASLIFDEIVKKNRATLGWEQEEMLKHRQMLRLTALLHDIGHAPFSHVGDALFPPTIGNHESMAAYLIKNSRLAELIDEVGRIHGFNHKEIAGIIEGTLSSEYTLINQIFASQLDADKMDYLLRDSMMSGVSYGKFDLNHLIRSLNISFEDEIPTLVVEQMGIHVIEELILARYFMFIQVYFHKTRRAYDKILSKIIYDNLPSNVIPQEISEFLKWDDYKVLEIIKNVPNPYSRMFLERNHLKLAYEKFPYANEEEKTALRKISMILKSKGYADDKLIIDEFQQPPIKLTDEEGLPLLKIIDKSRKIRSVNEYSPILASMNQPIYLFRVYVHEEISGDVKRIIEEELR
jgi:HD superfamily phosphohydrolase/tRNA A-37 threonylcarbamoyl transferase component Bud32